MTFDSLVANDELVKSWKSELVNNQVLRMVLSAMDESSPVYDPLPPNATDTFAIHKGGLGEGYALYAKRLQELGTFQKPVKQLERDYGAGKKPKE